jgi:hypothetical protein
MTHIFYIRSYTDPEGSLYDYVTSFQSEELEDIFRRMNAVDGDERCCEIGVRSMMVGDIAITTTGHGGFICAAASWGRISESMEAELLGKVPELAA